MKTVLWVVGEPGAGKTTLCRSLLDADSRLIKSPKWTWGPRVAAAGHYAQGQFDGADTIPYNGKQTALEFWWELIAPKVQLTVLDGDRFSDELAFYFIRALAPSYRLCCVLLTPPPEVAAERRAQRSVKLQNPIWVKGRVTKARNFYAVFPEADQLLIDSTASVEAQREEVLGFIGSAEA